MKRSLCTKFFLVKSLKPNVFIFLILCPYCLFSRSLCTVVCKWTYTSDGGWDDSFWKMIGLEDLVKDKYEKIGISGVVLFYTSTYACIYKKIYTYKMSFAVLL